VISLRAWNGPSGCGSTAGRRHFIRVATTLITIPSRNRAEQVGQRTRRGQGFSARSLREAPAGRAAAEADVRPGWGPLGPVETRRPRRRRSMALPVGGVFGACSQRVTPRVAWDTVIYRAGAGAVPRRAGSPIRPTNESANDGLNVPRSCRVHRKSASRSTAGLESFRLRSASDVRGRVGGPAQIVDLNAARSHRHTSGTPRAA